MLKLWCSIVNLPALIWILKLSQNPENLLAQWAWINLLITPYEWKWSPSLLMLTINLIDSKSNGDVIFTFGDLTKQLLTEVFKKQRSCCQHRSRIGCHQWWYVKWRFWLSLILILVQMRSQFHKTRFSLWNVLLKRGRKFPFRNQGYWKSVLLLLQISLHCSKWKPQKHLP